MDFYNEETRTLHGRDYQIRWFYDECSGAPWEDCDGHGIVTEWERRDKHPGELVLNEDRGSFRFYDLQATMKKAKAEGWGISGDTEGMTRGQIVAESVRRDYEYLRAWCNDQWHYCGIEVCLLNSEGDVVDTSSLWGIESDCDHGSIIDDLIYEVDPKMAA